LRQWRSFDAQDGLAPCQRSNPAPRAHSAFTLTELAIVIMIMGIFAAVAVPKFIDSLQFYRIESAARRVKADLNLLRHTARLTSSTQSVTFVGSTYTLSAGVAGLDRQSDAYSVNLAAAPYHLTAASAKFGDDPFVSFDGYGMPSSEGAVSLETPAHECTVLLGANGDITISRDYKGGLTPE
jgi:prepilin-type N-terminal cleavage/methylation domain-containing protein